MNRVTKRATDKATRINIGLRGPTVRTFRFRRSVIQEGGKNVIYAATTQSLPDF